MCGICGGAWVDRRDALGEADLLAMMDRIAHRGPDDAGHYLDDRAALGFRRLAILDIPGGRQPLANEDGSIRVVFNGEIYNFPALRRRLEARGHALRSSGDTETLVHLYEDEGPGMFALLRGMFALAIWDAPRRRLLLGRDRLGQKPLVYVRTPGAIRFASELKALLVDPALPRTIDPVALDRYLTFGYVPHPDAILRDVRKLPPAHYAVWDAGGGGAGGDEPRFRLERYWEPDWNLEIERPIGEEVEELRATLDDAVREQMVADVPVGAFLSGGVDSTLIVGLMRRHATGPVRTFSIGFDDPAFDERAHAETAARTLGTEHRAFVVEPTAWELAPELAKTFDEPFADSSALPTWRLARETRARVTVALTGDAGDELFGGYDRYRALALTARMERWPRSIRKFLAGPLASAIPASSRAKTRLRRVRRLLEALADPPAARYVRWCATFRDEDRAELYTDDWMAALAEAAGERPAEGLRRADPAAVLERGFVAAAGRDPATRAAVADLLAYLPDDLLHKVDMASMAHGLECRSPFLDHRVVELALTIPTRRKLGGGLFGTRGGKAILKRAFADVIPPSIRRRAKMGFGVPIDRWFRGPLKEELRAVLLDPVHLGRGMFRPEAVARLIDEHVGGARDHAYRLWALLALELWFRIHIDPPADRRGAGAGPRFGPGSASVRPSPT